MRHFDVHQNHVGTQFPNLFDRVVAVASLSDHRNIRKPVEKIVNYFAKVAMVISDQYSDPLHGIPFQGFVDLV
jgi:hypothetical protein